MHFLEDTFLKQTYIDTELGEMCRLKVSLFLKNIIMFYGEVKDLV